jgi:PIN domain nuclease of toxin-antitoxin system
MRLLLDTHIALWSIADDPRLSGEARNLIAEPANEILVSVASLWEIAIKHALSRLGRADMALSAHQAHQYFREAGYHMLGIDAAHAIAVEALPALHGDPFDRILVAQALSEPARLITHDTKVAAYSDTIIAV